MKIKSMRAHRWEAYKQTTGALTKIRILFLAYKAQIDILFCHIQNYEKVVIGTRIKLIKTKAKCLHVFL